MYHLQLLEVARLLLTVAILLCSILCVVLRCTHKQHYASHSAVYARSAASVHSRFRFVAAAEHMHWHYGGKMTCGCVRYTS